MVDTRRVDLKPHFYASDLALHTRMVMTERLPIQCLANLPISGQTLRARMSHSRHPRSPAYLSVAADHLAYILVIGSSPDDEDLRMAGSAS